MKTRLAPLARALAALLALALIETGVPLGLLRVGIMPHHVPSMSQLGTTLTSPDNGSLLLGAITAAGWAAWAAFTTAVLIETVAALRHRGAPRIRTLGAVQHLAAGLVASIIVLLPATSGALTASAAAPAATLHLPHATVTSPGAATAQPATTGATVAATWSGPVHQVRGSDETLWDVAQATLGDGKRWKQIADLNQGIEQPGGGTVTASTLQLTSGWTLRLPSDARTTTPGAAAVEQSVAVQPAATHQPRAGARQAPDTGHNRERVHLVRPGDTLSQIALEDLGTAADYPAIAAANRHTVQSDGRHLTDPDLIYPGWKLTIPHPIARPAAPPHHDAGSPAPTPATGSGTASTTDPGSTGSSPQPTAAASAPATAAPAASPAGAPVSRPAAVVPPTAQPSTAAAAAPNSAVAAPVAAAPVQASDANSPARLGAGITALLAAGLLGGYGVKRCLQQRRRGPGETIAVPAQTSSLEHALVQLAEPPSAELLDRALRTMAHLLPADADLPELHGARFTSSGVHLYAEGEPLAPFTAGPTGWWQLDPAHPLLDDQDTDAVPAPYPLLTTLGVQPDHGALLADLAMVRTVLLDGDHVQVREVARSLALEAATSPWGQDVSVLCAVLTDPDLPAISHTGRLQHLRDLGEAVKDLAELLLTAHQDDEAPLPWMVVLADQADPQDAWQLADLVARVPGAPIALVLPADGLDTLFPDALHLDCRITDPQTGPLPGADVVLQRVTERMYEQLVADLRTTEQPATPADGPWAHVPDSVGHMQAPEAEPDPDPVEALAGDAGQQVADAAVSPFLAFTHAQSTAVTSGTGTGAVPLLPAPRADVTVHITDDTDTPHWTGLGGGPPTTESTATRADNPATATEDEPLADAPEILVLGPLDITGLGVSGRGRRLADLAAFLYLHPHRTAEAIAEAMSPIAPWSRRTVVARLSDLRKLLNTAPDGTPYLPRVAHNATYPQLTGVRCDWTRFLRLAERGLLAGPAGVSDLESALRLVRGRPFQGSSASWAMPEQQEMVSRIVDVAHTTAVQRISTGDWDAARWAIGTGVAVESTAELLYRDWITLEHRRGNPAEMGRVISALQKALRPLNVDMEPATEKLITDIYARDQQRTPAH